MKALTEVLFILSLLMVTGAVGALDHGSTNTALTAAILVIGITLLFIASVIAAHID